MKRMMVMKRSFSALLYAFLVWNMTAETTAQPIGGVINTYWPVTAIDVCNNRIALPVLLSGVNIGDKILMIQMQGAAIDTNDVASYGTVTGFSHAGYFEMLTVRDVTNNLITFDEIFLNSYDVSGKVQAILVPQFADVTIGGVLTALPWNGSSGGVLALIASGTVTLNADLDVSGAGFRGGGVIHSGACYSGGAGFSGYCCNVSAACGGQKGESIAGPLYQNLGRGAPANGGGGGNDSNTGGGGGSNAATGGDGGFRVNLSASCSGDFPGKGGYELPYLNSDPRVFLGGGGGAGDDNSNGASAGGNGGGIIILQAASVAGNNFSILARGSDVTPDPALLDGAGGGGGGGVVLLDAGSITDVIVSVNGGLGGSVDNGTVADSCFGPGGGGGAGMIWVSGSTIPPVFMETSGNASGTTNGSACSSTTNGASSGSSSTVLTNLQVPQSAVIYVPLSLSLSEDTVVCLGTGAFLEMTAAGTGTLTYSWSTGANTDTTTAYPTGLTTYYASVTDSRGCSLTETLEVDVMSNSVTASAFPDSIVLGYGSIQLIADSTGNEFFFWYPNTWLNNATVFNPVAIPEDTITYCVIATGYNGCLDTACVDVLVVIPEATIHIPTAFTPNNDGINDTWDLILHPCYELMSVKVFNRWGMLVYDYEQAGTNPWNGTRMGAPLPMEVYMYHIVARCNERDTDEEFFGNLTLIR